MIKNILMRTLTRQSVVRLGIYSLSTLTTLSIALFIIGKIDLSYLVGVTIFFFIFFFLCSIALLKEDSTPKT